jgi:hypothetical protein
MQTKEDLEKHERDWRLAFEKIHNKRVNDKREFKSPQKGGAYLTADMLRNRQKLTDGGTQELVLDYGTPGSSKHRELRYSLQELNEIAAARKKARRSHHGATAGIPISAVLKRALDIDKARAKDVRASTLFKVEGNTLHFRVTASGESEGAPSHYTVRIRLEDWDDVIHSGDGKSYLIPARMAVAGPISFDCGCGRWLYWFHYLASIGNFDLKPHEGVFPKVRNKGLTGICCKHILKTISSVQSPVILQQIVRQMEKAAKNKGFDNMDAPIYMTRKAVGDKTVKELEDAGMLSDASAKAFEKQMEALKAFAKVHMSPKAQEARNKLDPRRDKKMETLRMQKDVAETVAKAEIKKRRELEADIKKYQESQRTDHAAMLKALKQSGVALSDEFFTNYAKAKGTDKAALEQIAKEEGLL